MSQDIVELAEELQTFFKKHPGLPEYIFDVSHNYKGHIEKRGSLHDLLTHYEGLLADWQNCYNNWSYERTSETGGSEGDGEENWVVYTFKKKGSREKLLIRFDGKYQSYSGSSYESWFFVSRRVVRIAYYDPHPLLKGQVYEY